MATDIKPNVVPFTVPSKDASIAEMLSHPKWKPNFFTTHLNTDKPYHCNDCAKQFTGNRCVYRHFYAIHCQGYQCPFCLKCFSESYALKNHQPNMCDGVYKGYRVGLKRPKKNRFGAKKGPGRPKKSGINKVGGRKKIISVPQAEVFEDLKRSVRKPKRYRENTPEQKDLVKDEECPPSIVVNPCPSSKTENPISNADAPVKIKTDGKTCHNCNKTFNSNMGLRGHRRVCKPAHTVSPVKEKESTCNKPHKNRNVLKANRQMRKRGTGLNCSSCGLKFKTIKRLNRHESKYSTGCGFSRQECTICKKSITNVYMMRFHMKKFHNIVLAARKYRKKKNTSVELEETAIEALTPEDSVELEETHSEETAIEALTPEELKELLNMGTETSTTLQAEETTGEDTTQETKTEFCSEEYGYSNNTTAAYSHNEQDCIPSDQRPTEPESAPSFEDDGDQNRATDGQKRAEMMSIVPEPVPSFEDNIFNKGEQNQGCSPPNARLLFTGPLPSFEDNSFNKGTPESSSSPSDNSEDITRVETELPFACQGCDVKFSSMAEFKQHIYTVHMKLHLPFKCPYCDFRVKEKKKLTEHLVSKHLDTKPFKCRVCRKGFAERENMKDHVEQGQCTPSSHDSNEDAKYIKFGEEEIAAQISKLLLQKRSKDEPMNVKQEKAAGYKRPDEQMSLSDQESHMSEQLSQQFSHVDQDLQMSQQMSLMSQQMSQMYPMPQQMSQQMSPMPKHMSLMSQQMPPMPQQMSQQMSQMSPMPQQMSFVDQDLQMSQQMSPMPQHMSPMPQHMSQQMSLLSPMSQQMSLVDQELQMSQVDQDQPMSIDNCPPSNIVYVDPEGNVISEAKVENHYGRQFSACI